MKFSVDSVTCAGHHGRTSGRWWVGGGPHQEVARRAAACLPSTVRAWGSLWRPCGVTAQLRLPRGHNSFLLGKENYFHSFPEQWSKNILVTCIQDGRWCSEDMDWKGIPMKELTALHGTGIGVWKQERVEEELEGSRGALDLGAVVDSVFKGKLASEQYLVPGWLGDSWEQEYLLLYFEVFFCELNAICFPKHSVKWAATHQMPYASRLWGRPGEGRGFSADWWGWEVRAAAGDCAGGSGCCRSSWPKTEREDSPGGPRELWRVSDFARELVGDLWRCYTDFEG